MAYSYQHRNHMALLSLILLLLPWSTASANEECFDCHEDIRDAITEQIYVHEPVRLGDCHVCHSASHMPVKQEKNSPDPQQRYVVHYQQDDNKQQELPIKWLAENFTPSTEQHALLKEKDLKDKLIIDLWDPEHGNQKKEFMLPELSTLPQQNPHNQMLSIDNLHLSDFDTRLLPRATVRWQTNEPSRCTSHYGNETLDFTVKEDDLYMRDHKLELRNFNEAGYVIQIECRDPFKRKKKTDILNITQLPVSQNKPQTGAADDTDIQLTTIKNKLWVSITSSTPVSLSVGTQQARLDETEDENTVPALPNVQPGQYNPAPEEDHIVLNSTYYTTTEVCHSCHGGLEEGASHPVNVQPPPNMVIPPEYPRLRDGRISCMSCHTVHTGNIEYRLLKKSKRKLCTGCHTNY